MRTLTALILTAALAAPAFAQPQRPRGGGFGGMMGGLGGGASVFMLRSEDVQKDLKLTDEQKTKIKDFQEKQASLFQGFRPGGGGERPDPEKIREAIAKMTEDTTKFLKDTLTEEQNKRLKQIALQQSLKSNPAGALFTMNFSREGLSLGDPTETGKALKITDEQKEKIKEISDQANKDRRELFGAGGGGGGGGRRELTPEQRKKMENLNKEVSDKVMEVLTAEQRKQLDELKGKPFEGRIDVGGSGGGRRPGGAGGNRGPGGGGPGR